LHRAKHAAEQDLVAGDLPWTIVRPSSYIETWIGVMGAQSENGGAALVFGRGSNPINFVSVRDVALLVERVIDQPELRNKSIDVAGPDNLTMVDVARQLGATRIRHVPRVALRLLTATARPFAPALARQAATALFMDTTGMTADAADLIRDFPDVHWHHVRDITTTDERRR
jgi:NADH dehydrogenase